jgi:hypothetical protein
MKKSITYKEAKKIALAIFLLNLIVESINLGNPGPSTHKTDEFGGDLRMRKSQDLDAAPLRKNILNCRKRNRNGRRNGNLILYDKRECPLFEETWNRKIYKEKINSNHLTSQNGTDFCTPPNSIQGCQIHKQKSTYDTIHITFQFFTEVKIEIKKMKIWVFSVKRRKLISLHWETWTVIIISKIDLIRNLLKYIHILVFLQCDILNSLLIWICHEVFPPWTLVQSFLGVVSRHDC